MTTPLSTTAAATAVPAAHSPAPPLGLRAMVRADIDAWQRIFCGTDSSPSSGGGWNLVWSYAGLRATLLYRVSHALWRSRVPALPGMVGRLNLFLHGLDIPASVEIGPGLYLPHPVGTVVMARRIGARVSLITSITIGMRETRAFPVLGDDVFVGAGARILGDITIGDGASIGANAVVLSDVPPGATAVGIPAKIKPAKANPTQDAAVQDAAERP